MPYQLTVTVKPLFGKPEIVPFSTPQSSKESAEELKEWLTSRGNKDIEIVEV